MDVDVASIDATVEHSQVFSHNVESGVALASRDTDENEAMSWSYE